ncbi:hypothetical protein ASF60_07610 [Methylobacterium sp. Leaf113]|uniref:hypothetical protein n=1 Tax=Methylobacterium sp. Leaf113 TaxID=1736259 RepID=UPI0006F6D350|nr:hypothetical protein [Methylobacterium sp. Leaf113]KQP75008.1 hypothetical protein ASF60_07610 [Methylobacterium sp. Leaf113]
MSSSQSLTSIDVSEYDRIEAAMTESERGRWFLDAYLRRNRTSDTGILLDAIARLEAAVTSDRDTSQIGRVRGDLMDMAHAIARTKAEIAAIKSPDQDQSSLGGASAALDAIVRSTERATSDILSAAENVQETAWNLRESGSDAAACDELDRRATAIYTACSFQDLTAQRIARVIHTLRYLEERLAAMMAIWGDALDPVPTAPGGSATPEVPADLCQSDVDRYIAMDTSAAEPRASTPVPLPDGPMADDIVFLEVTDAVMEPDREPDAVEVPDLEASDLEAPDLESSDLNAFEADAPEMDASEGDAPDVDASGLSTALPEAAASFDKPLDADEGRGDAQIRPDAEDQPQVASVDDVADRMSPPTVQVSEKAQTDIATAFAEIDALTDDEKRALFS